jgi:hypothetical protein
MNKYPEEAKAHGKKYRNGDTALIRHWKDLSL